MEYWKFVKVVNATCGPVQNVLKHVQKVLDQYKKKLSGPKNSDRRKIT